MKHELLTASCAALLEGARAVGNVKYDSQGYAPSSEENLWRVLPVDEITQDLKSGAGGELNGKLRAAHSSAALAVNTFGPWRRVPHTLRIGDASHFDNLRFEAVCPTGLRGTPPHLDLLALGPTVVAIESKCTEWMSPKRAMFSPAYDTLKYTHGHSPWFKQIEALRDQPAKYRYLDSAQLIKHALGLSTSYKSRPVELLYLYWEPRNAQEWPQCAAHREEATGLASLVAGATVVLRPLSYSELWSSWQENPPDHLPYLRTRYDRVV